MRKLALIVLIATFFPLQIFFAKVGHTYGEIKEKKAFSIVLEEYASIDEMVNLYAENNYQVNLELLAELTSIFSQKPCSLSQLAILNNSILSTISSGFREGLKLCRDINYNLNPDRNKDPSFLNAELSNYINLIERPRNDNSKRFENLFFSLLSFLPVSMDDERKNFLFFALGDSAIKSENLELHDFGLFLLMRNTVVSKDYALAKTSYYHLLDEIYLDFSGSAGSAVPKAWLEVLGTLRNVYHEAL